MSTKHIWLAGIFLLFVTRLISAQNDTIRIMSRMDQNRLENNHLWLESDNAAGLRTYSIQDYNNLDFHYTNENGDFKKSMMPSSSQQYGVFTSGYKSIEKIDFYGFFKYTRKNEKDVNWISMMDRKSPYLIADSIGGDWNKDFYTLNMKMGTDPLLGNFRFGLSATYRVAQGGRDNDPRPKSNIKDLSIKPGIVWDMNSSQHLGLTFLYRDYRQDVNIMNKYGVGGNMIYKIIGLALLEQPIVKPSLEYRIDNWSRGTAVQYNLERNKYSLMAELGYNLINEKGVQSPYRGMEDSDANEIVSLAISDIRTSVKRYDGSVTMRMPAKNALHILRIEGVYDEGKTYNESTEQVEFIHDKIYASLNYDIYKKEQGWHLVLNADYMKDEQENLFYGNQNIENIKAVISGEKEFSFRLYDFSANLALGYSYNLNSDLVLDPQSDFIESTYDITNPYVKLNYDYLASDYYWGQGGLTYYYPLKGKNRLFIGLNASYYQAKEESSLVGNDRFMVSSNIGIIF